MSKRAVAWIQEARNLLADGKLEAADERLRRALDVLDRPLTSTWTVAEILARES